MAIVYGEIDCLSKITSLLRGDVVTSIRSFDDLLEYKRECERKVKEAEIAAKEEFKLKIQLQKDSIAGHLAGYEKLNGTGFYLRIVIRTLVFKLKLFRMNRSLKSLEKKSNDFIRSRTEVLSGNFYRSKQVFDSNYNLIQGASGEQQALDELRKLPDSFYVVNNVQISFNKPLYEPRSRQRIYSIQADHIVIAPSGIFLIETKNWSRGTASLDSSFSAFDQINRTNFALYCYFNPRFRGFFSLFVKSKKIKIRSVLLMTGHKTESKDRFVKVLDLNQLRNYIEYFSPELTADEMQDSLNKLIR